MTAATATAVIRERRPLPTWAIAAILTTGSVALGFASAAFGPRAEIAAVSVLLAVALLVLLWRRPDYSAGVLLLSALTVEQFPFTTGQPGATSPGTTPSDYTDRLPLFHGLSNGVHVSPADLLLLTLLVYWMLKRGTSATAPLPRTAVTLCVGAVLAAVAVGVVVGQAHHGELRAAFTEVRPYVYLGIAYAVTSVFTTRLNVLRMAMWAIVLGSGFKAAQAFHSFLTVRSQIPRPDFVVGHEEALFFGIFILLTACLWIFQFDGPLRTTATALLPLVLVADLVNSRRAAWLILGGALIALTLITMVAVPARRRFMTRILVLGLIASAVYFPAYWNHTGALAGPARALKSAVSPNVRDESSDLYRVQENANLKLNIREGGVLGRGFGRPIDYALPIVDISSIDPLIRFIPHNGVFYIFMRMGLLGAIAFWSLLGTAIISACRLVRSRNREVALFGMLLACSLVGYALEGYNDQGFFMYRIAFVMGTLLGLGEAARRLDLRGAVAVPARVPAQTPSPSRAAPPPVQPVAVEEPVPVESASAADTEPTRTPWDRITQIAAVVLLVVAVAFFLWLAFFGSTRTVTRPGKPTRQVVVRATPVSVTHPAAPAFRSAPTAAPHPVEVSFVNVKHDSWAEVRRGSATGPVLYSGVVRVGQRIDAQATRVWARFGAAGNFQITSNGRPVDLQGTIDVLFTEGGARQ